jgi:hypothetical protein
VDPLLHPEPLKEPQKEPEQEPEPQPQPQPQQEPEPEPEPELELEPEPEQKPELEQGQEEPEQEEPEPEQKPEQEQEQEEPEQKPEQKPEQELEQQKQADNGTGAVPLAHAKSEGSAIKQPPPEAVKKTTSAPVAMPVPVMSDITVEGRKDDALHDGMFEACRRRVSDATLEQDFKLLKDSKYALSYKDKDKSLAIRTFVQKRKALGFPAKEAFALQTDPEYEQSSDSAIKNYEVLQSASEDKHEQGHIVSYQLYNMPMGIDNREFLTMRRTVADDQAGVYEMISRSVAWPSRPAQKKPFRATVFRYTRVERVSGNPDAHTCTNLTYTDLKGGLQQKMAGQMEKAMVSRADDEAKALSKRLAADMNQGKKKGEWPKPV